MLTSGLAGADRGGCRLPWRLWNGTRSQKLTNKQATHAHILAFV